MNKFNYSSEVATVSMAYFLAVVLASVARGDEPLANLHVDAWKQMLSDAASVSKDDSTGVMNHEIKEIRDFQSKSLTAFLLADRPTPGRKKPYFEEFNLGPGDRAINVSLLFSMLQLKDGSLSYLRPDHIREIKGAVEKGEVTGRVTFDAINPKDNEAVFSGQVMFKAIQVGGGWKITQFILPVRKIAITLEEGKWVSKPL